MTRARHPTRRCLGPAIAIVLLSASLHAAAAQVVPGDTIRLSYVQGRGTTGVYVTADTQRVLVRELDTGDTTNVPFVEIANAEVLREWHRGGKEEFGTAVRIGGAITFGVAAFLLSGRQNGDRAVPVARALGVAGIGTLATLLVATLRANTEDYTWYAFDAGILATRSP